MTPLPLTFKSIKDVLGISSNGDINYYSMRERILTGNFNDDDFDMSRVCARWTISMSPISCGIVCTNKLFPFLFARNTTKDTTLTVGDYTMLIPGCAGNLGNYSTAYENVGISVSKNYDTVTNFYMPNLEAARYLPYPENLSMQRSNSYIA